MPFQFEKRENASKRLLFLAPFIAIVLATGVTCVLLALLGKSPFEVIKYFFFEPFASVANISETFLKFGPLLLIAQALAIGFRAKVWNIGAEGQMIMGAIAASSVPITFNEVEGFWVLPSMILLGAGGGMAWAGIAAFLRTRFNANEILVTLMLSAIALQILFYLMLGPWRDPDGFNFPQSVLFQDSAMFPILINGTRLNYSIFIPIAFTVFAYIYMQKHFQGFMLMVSGLAPAAAGYAGFDSKSAIWKSLLIAGCVAGIAGTSEVAGPIGQLQRSITSGYGYSAIIVAYLGALHPIGIIFAAFFLSVIHIGGDIARVQSDIPISTVHIFQGLLLVFYLASNVFVSHRIKRTYNPIPHTPQPD